MIIVIVLLSCIVLGLAVALSRMRFSVLMMKEKVKEIEKERDAAKHEVEAKDLFVQNMSHEVRTPLNAVVGFAQLLSMPPEFITPEERKEYSEHIAHNSNLLTMLIDDILSISDVQSGNYSINPTMCSLNEIAKVALSAVKYRVKANIDLKFISDVDDNYQIKADARRVQQILINYLTNAIKHTQIGSITLRTSITEHPGMVTFAVEDTGEGVPIGQARNVFRRFTKLNDFVQGTGLGLNICLTLAEKMKGQVFLDTSYTHGARFVFCMPIEKE